jgi:hypothetical protein
MTTEQQENMIYSFETFLEEIKKIEQYKSVSIEEVNSLIFQYVNYFGVDFIGEDSNVQVAIDKFERDTYLLNNLVI